MSDSTTGLVGNEIFERLSAAKDLHKEFEEYLHVRSTIECLQPLEITAEHETEENIRYYSESIEQAGEDHKLIGCIGGVPLFAVDFKSTRDIKEIWYERLLRMRLRAAEEWPSSTPNF